MWVFNSEYGPRRMLLRTVKSFLNSRSRCPAGTVTATVIGTLHSRELLYVRRYHSASFNYQSPFDFLKNRPAKTQHGQYENLVDRPLRLLFRMRYLCAFPILICLSDLACRYIWMVLLGLPLCWKRIEAHRWRLLRILLHPYAAFYGIPAGRCL